MYFLISYMGAEHSSFLKVGTNSLRPLYTNNRFRYVICPHPSVLQLWSLRQQPVYLRRTDKTAQEALFGVLELETERF